MEGSRMTEAMILLGKTLRFCNDNPGLLKLPGDVEIRVLDPKSKLLGFHMSGLVTHPYKPNKETW
jgi:hypothetical protein